MTRIRISMMILSAFFATVAWGQQSATNRPQQLEPSSRAPTCSAGTRTRQTQRAQSCAFEIEVELRRRSASVFRTGRVDNVVYAGAYDGNLYAWNATTGAKLWQLLHRVRQLDILVARRRQRRGVFQLGVPWRARRNLCGQHQQRHSTVELPNGQRFVRHADSSQWRGVLRRLGRAHVRAERDHRRRAVDL